MLILFILTPFFEFLNWLVGLLPSVKTDNLSLCNFLDFFRCGLWFFDTYVFRVCFGVVFIFTSLQLGWAIFEWVYKKFPGVK